MKMFKFLTLLLTVAFVGGLGALSFSARASTSTGDFVHKASEAGLFEIQSSKIALNKSQNPDVKKFALEMVDDHTAASEKLTNTLSSDSDDSGQVANQLSPAHQKIIARLNRTSGDDFDRQYVSAQLDAHKDAVKLFSDYSSNGDNAPLRDFATQTLPTLQQHLVHAKQLSSSM